MEITNHTIHDVGKDIDRRIFVLLHVRGLGIEEIAATVGLSTAAVNRRYYRLIQQVTGLVRERAKKDPHLNRVFEAILVDDQLFRCSLLGLLNVISRKGFSAIRQILESFLS
jgi:AcrR family transcriptional regulator